MTLDNRAVSRRAVLRLAGFSAAALATAAFAEAPDLKELKQEVEELKYDEEVTEVGPDAAEKNILRAKKPEATPEYVEENAEIIETEKANYDAMLDKEKADADALKAKFGKE